jgi:hypothetical protein
MNEPVIQTDLVSGSSTAQYIQIENKTNVPQIAEVTIENLKNDAKMLPNVFFVRIESDDELHRLLYGPTTLQQLLDHGPVQLETLGSTEHQSYVLFFTANQNIGDELQNKQLHFDLALKLKSVQTSPQPSPRSSPTLKVEAAPVVLGTSSAQTQLSTVQVSTPSSTLMQGKYLFSAILSLSCAICFLFLALVLFVRRPS